MTAPSPLDRRRERRVPAPLDAARLEALALAYVARFATSAGKLRDYLGRKLRSRGWAGEGAAPPLDTLVARFVEAGYLDDAAYAQARSGGMLRRGLGARRISATLQAAGIGEEDRAGAMPGVCAARQAALAFAQKRRLGPFGAAGLDRAQREKQLGAMLRAGHRLDSARELVNFSSEQAALDWAAGDEGEDG